MSYKKSLLSAPRHRQGNVFIVLGMLLSTLFLLLCHGVHAEENSLFRPLPPETANLDTYQWHNRPVILFASSAKDADYVKQMTSLLKSKAELAERDMVVLSDTSPAANGQLRSQFKPTGFEIILVGKDGGVKLRENTPVTPEELLTLIDGMPMRKANLH